MLALAFSLYFISGLIGILVRTLGIVKHNTIIKTFGTVVIVLTIVAMFVAVCVYASSTSNKYVDSRKTFASQCQRLGGFTYTPVSGNPICLQNGSTVIAEFKP